MQCMQKKKMKFFFIDNVLKELLVSLILFKSQLHTKVLFMDTE